MKIHKCGHSHLLGASRLKITGILAGAAIILVVSGLILNWTINRMKAPRTSLNLTQSQRGKADFNVKVTQVVFEVMMVEEDNGALDEILAGACSGSKYITNLVVKDWPILQDQSHGISAENEIERQGFGLLAPVISKSVLQQVEQRYGVPVLKMPNAVTVCGRQAHFAMQDRQKVILDSGETKEVSVGPCVDMVANVQPDGRTIDLVVITSTTEAGKSASKGIHLRKMAHRCDIQDGETLLLAGFPKEEEKNAKKTVFFITPTLIDAAGNRINPSN